MMWHLSLTFGGSEVRTLIGIHLSYKEFSFVLGCLKRVLSCDCIEDKESVVRWLRSRVALMTSLEGGDIRGTCSGLKK